jgi:3-hydroxy-D-aspartate aldolase
MKHSLQNHYSDRILNRPWKPLPLNPAVSLDEIPTPALTVDLERMEHNMARMANYLGDKGIGLRPHTKTHKCPVVAHKQLEEGAIGICCAKVAEAEVMQISGISSILITSPVVTPDKVARVARLASVAPELLQVVDSILGIDRLGEAARAAGTVVSVLVDIDPLGGRTGVSYGNPTLRMVEKVASTKGLAFCGLQMYAGGVMHLENYQTRRERSRELWMKGLETKSLVEAQGHPVGVVTGGGTGTYNIDSDIVGVTDIQAGSYIFMDREYHEIGNRAGSSIYQEFEPALFVLATAISQPRENGITVDAGYKSFATDSVVPVLLDSPETTYRFAGDEHGILSFGKADRRVALGDRVRIFVPHCDPTINLYDYLVPYRDNEVSELWPVAGRGCSW